MIKVVCGLGNPGLRYRHARHNLGYEVIDRLAGSKRMDEFESHPLFEFLHLSLGGEVVWLMKPTTFMNRSGLAVAAAMEKFDLPIERFFVIVDDFNLEFGQLRIRKKGSSGGHRGLESIIETIGRDSFPRLRLGIGPIPTGSADLPAPLGSEFSEEQEKRKDQVTEFVLGHFRPDEKGIVSKIISLAGQAITKTVKEGLDVAISSYNNNNPTLEN